MAILIVLIACVISAIFYRAGGMSTEPTSKPTWIPMALRHSWVRDWLCPGVLMTLVISIFGFHLDFWWCYLIFYGLSGAALSTYYDFLFGYDNYYIHGLGCSLATIPLLWCGLSWWILLIHIIVCTFGMGWISKKSNVDYIEEFGRGAFFIL
jgi:hypothetical protein